MKIKMTGGTGLVGSQILSYLQQQGHEVSDASSSSGVDLTNEKEFKEFFSIDDVPNVVIHSAAYTNVKEAQTQISEHDAICFHLNVLVTQDIAKYCFENNCHLIYLSTDYVFDGSKEDEYTEDDQPEPINWYGHTKYMGEREVIASAAEYTILRIAFPFDSDPVKSDFVQTIVTRLQSDTLYPMFVDQIITPTYIPDIVNVIAVIMNDRESATNQIFHCVGDESLSPYEVAQRIKNQLQSETKVEQGSVLQLMQEQRGVGSLYPLNLALSNEKLKETYGVTFTPLDNALAASLEGK